ncbi:helix-turn-helix domain-containing protein [Candidatus Enterococcus murrayae]|uniref:Helix-turn-helix domain-containing protein n=1 Tax=Candidatus Enterococcus murrayae TaxID=2815321 RepID=A0ABS3HN93_9ENTE|nr:helix-turn-helix domain-containing protein [Enterococcus sp. MJM16]MBO0454409.1 helix-turn-helix domain-containing protein [Enterococcus sp. MJM16]
MNQILILTKNILAEQEIQQKLQALNYEVYCSARMLETSRQQVEMLEFFNFFQYVILSETICESEVMELVPLLRKQPIRIIRKVEAKVTEMDHQYLEEELLHAIISNEDSVDELRECLSNLKQQKNELAYENRNYVQLSDKVSLIRPNVLHKGLTNPEDNYQFLEVLHHLSTTETRILSILLHAGNKVVTRETICHQIWNEDVNKSHLASLSSTVTRIKTKFEATNLTNKAIQTLWGKGYRINPELLDRINKNDTLHTLVSNG